MSAPAGIPAKKTIDDFRARWPHGSALSAKVMQESASRACLVSFSRGKDSIAATLALKEQGAFDQIVPFYAERVPGLSFIEESLAYYERVLFEQRIRVYPHPALYQQLNEHVFQSPCRVNVTRAAKLPEYDYTAIQEACVSDAKLPAGTYTATGLRSADSILRRTAIWNHGPITRKKQTFMPIWDFNKEDIVGLIRRHNIKLPKDYLHNGKTQDGLMAENIIWIRDQYPDDYKKILDWYPMIDAEVFRYEMLWGMR